MDHNGPIIDIQFAGTITVFAESTCIAFLTSTRLA
jgi:hypothetical protein